MVPMFFAARWVIRTSLAPLGAAAAQMDSVVGTDRGFRVNLGDFPLETQPFARALNDLLARLDEVAEQRETFAATVAHEQNGRPSCRAKVCQAVYIPGFAVSIK